MDFQQATNGGGDSKAQKGRLNMSLMIAESDYDKNKRRKEELELEIRGMRKKEQQIQFDIDDREEELKKLDNELMLSEQEIQRLRKKIKLL